MNAPRRVTVVIPTHNNLALLRRCLDAVRDLSYPRDALEVIVVDNGSTDRTTETLGARYPWVRLVPLEQNTGFAPACNRGAREASAGYIAFLNDDALPARDWIEALFAGLDAGGEGAVCAASHIRSRDGALAEYSGASSNLFAAGRPVSVWGWPDMPAPPGEGAPLLFASGGAMLIDRRVFLDAGGFDPEYFAYFEDVDLGWRLWVLGHRVVYAPGAVVRHIGGATGRRAPEHRRYTLWECNSLATVLKNYESGSMERILSAALLLEYKRALMASGDTIARSEYALSSPRRAHDANVEELPRVSVAHLAAIDRFNRLLPYFFAQRRAIQARRVRPDRDIIPLLGHLWQPQFAGTPYAGAARALADRLDLYGLFAGVMPTRVLVLSPRGEPLGRAVAEHLSQSCLVALVEPHQDAEPAAPDASYSLHTLPGGDPTLDHLAANAGVIVSIGSHTSALPLTPAALAAVTDTPFELPGTRVFAPTDLDSLAAFCVRPTPPT